MQVMTEAEQTVVILDEIVTEYDRAKRRFSPFVNVHEGIAVIEEEFLELRNEVFWGKKGQPTRQMRKEAVQLGAMALRFVIDIFGELDNVV